MYNHVNAQVHKKASGNKKNTCLIVFIIYLYSVRIITMHEQNEKYLLPENMYIVSCMEKRANPLSHHCQNVLLLCTYVLYTYKTYRLNPNVRK